MTRVFVYGTLKSGHCNNRLLVGQHYVGRAETLAPGLRLVDLGPFPGAVHSASPSRVYGEVWDIDDAALRRLDGLESNGSFYTREVVETSLGEAWVYVLPVRDYGDARPVTLGSWRPSQEEREWVEHVSGAGRSA